MPDAQLERVDGGVARTELSDGPPYPVWARILKPGDITQGGDGEGERNKKRSHWTEDALRQSADMFATNDVWTVHFVDGHPEDVGVRDILGESLETRLSDDYGLVAAGEIDDEHTARLIDNNRVGVSPWLKRTHGEWNEEKQAHDVDQVVGVRNIGIVDNAEGPSADINLGKPPESDSDAPSAEALAAVFEDGGGPETSAKGTHTDTHTAITDKSDATKETTETMSATETESNEDNPTDPGDGDRQDLSGMERDELIATLRKLRTENERLAEELAEERENLEDVEGDVEELEAQLGELGELDDGLTEALSAQTGLDEEIVEDSFGSLGAKVEALEADPVAAFKGATGNEYTPDPQTGDPNPGGSGGSGGSSSGGVETLSAEQREEIEVLERRKELADRRGYDTVVESAEESIEEIRNGGGPEGAAGAGGEN